eukprot:364731-Chlamydomonas_euryale.AAC.17
MGHGWTVLTCGVGRGLKWKCAAWEARLHWAAARQPHHMTSPCPLRSAGVHAQEPPPAIPSECCQPAPPCDAARLRVTRDQTGHLSFGPPHAIGLLL